MSSHKYKVIKQDNRYIGFLSFVDGAVCCFKLTGRKSRMNEGKSKETAHYSAILDEECPFILKREGESETLITGQPGDEIGIREIPPIKALANLATGTYVRLRVLGIRMQGERPRHDIEIAIAEE